MSADKAPPISFPFRAYSKAEHAIVTLSPLAESLVQYASTTNDTDYLAEKGQYFMAISLVNHTKLLATDIFYLARIWVCEYMGHEPLDLTQFNSQTLPQFLKTGI